ncbi:MAG: glycosyltransferase family 39 protein [Phycisphaerales bacterium]
MSNALDRLVAAVARATRWHLPIVLAVCAAVYWPGLGGPGLRSSEGHRAIPGWTIAQTGEWVPTRLFEASYLRKPPGMPWAVALSTLIFGEREWSARAVSALAATGMAVTAFLFARRWFGSKGHGSIAGLAAGLSQALLPVAWSIGRTTEIEALLCFTTQLSALLLIDLLVFQQPRAAATGTPPRAAAPAIWILTAGLALFACLLVKGPAGLPVIGGVITAACIAARSWRPLIAPRLWLTIAIALACSAALVAATWSRISGEAAETESLSGFLWSVERLGKVAIFAPSVAVMMLPASLWLAFGLWRGVRDQGPHGRVASALAWSFVLGMAVSMAAGMWNPRYGLPAMATLAPLAGYVASAWASGDLEASRRTLARRMCLGSPVVLACVLIVGVAANYAWFEPKSAARSTRPAGILVGKAVDHDAEIWASNVINTKPELLYYARAEAATRGIHLRPLWLSRRIAACEMPPPRSYLALTPAELAKYEAAGLSTRFENVTQSTGDGMAFVIVQVR